MVIEDSNKKWKELSPGDGPEESNKPVVLAFGAVMFGNLRGNVPAPTKVVKDSRKKQKNTNLCCAKPEQL
ncbi:hypothetical protein INT48_003688 [Thamnidium elegans]|uniref:Uncharacterized protein n=1 Tax=Thamnidium elegans TaxID=101142 RepID=A0A8H7SNJ2_9FUNG|nr:hypothetical protein INT48_003688 [Thamnidium elegans]